MEDNATLPRSRNASTRSASTRNVGARSAIIAPETLPPVQAEPSRLERITVCTRPFRAAGPRIEAERLHGTQLAGTQLGGKQLGSKLLIHNYGHGGSGWSLSWGSAARVLQLLRESARVDPLGDIAVIGCGAMGLTTAVTLQRAGLRVRIYARDLPPDVRSSRATGLWSPDSRFALAKDAGADLAERWEAMARHSWSVYCSIAGKPNAPVDVHDRYLLSDLSPTDAIALRQSEDPIGFAHFEHRLADLYRGEDLGPGEHPFPTAWARRVSTFRFNIAAYTEKLLSEFRDAGGQLQRREFHTRDELTTLPESAVVHCTGYGARALFGDDSLIPVRGQIGWLPAQPELGYSLQWDRLSMVPRGDGIAVQVGAASDDTGWNDAGEIPNREESEAAVRALQRLQSNGCKVLCVQPD